MMRACHLNTCPVGIATQDPELRKRFTGQPEHVVNYFFFVAEEVRQIMATLGVRRFEELIGRTEMLRADEAIDHWKGRGVDLTHLLHFPTDVDPSLPRRRLQPPPPVLEDALDHELILGAGTALEDGTPVSLKLDIRNVNRCVGGMLSSKIAETHGAGGLADGSVKVCFTGSAGQSFGGWLAPGVEFTLHGDANDYTGKGLSAACSRCARRTASATWPRRTSSWATPCSTAPRRGARSSAGRPASASRCATRGRPRSSRASATTAAST
jgi:glutamate synthase (NADPH/NADH) large chain/glutamate synthase (ferredoxin)